MTDCWSCGVENAASVRCTACGKLQPLAAQNHFELLGLPAQLTQAHGEVDRAFRGASKDVHPDRLGPGASTVERQLAVAHTARLNEAYRALKDAQTRAEYLLSLQGVTVGGETARTNDTAFLLEMMEQQEAVDAAATVDQLESQRQQITGRKRDQMAGLARYFDQGEGQQDDAARALNELRYLKRLLDRIDAKLEEMM